MVLKIILIILAVLVVLFAVLWTVIYFGLFKTNIARPPKVDDIYTYDSKFPMYYHNDIVKTESQWLYSQKLEDVEVKSFDNLTLKGIYLKNENAKATMLFMHGVNGHPVRDFAGLYSFFYNKGFNVLLAYERAQMESEGSFITFGMKERFDCHSWVDFINERNGKTLPVMIYGTSMGCASVLMSLGTEYPENVKGIFADCGFTTPYEEFCFFIKNVLHLPVFPIIQVADLMCKIKAGFGLKEYSTETALKENKIPVFFSYGTADRVVSNEMPKKNIAACSAPKMVFVTEGADHGMAFFDNPDGWRVEASKFLDLYLK